MSLELLTFSILMNACVYALMHSTEILLTTPARVVMGLVLDATQLAQQTAMPAQAPTTCNMALMTALPPAPMENTQFPQPICACLVILTV